MRIARLAVLGPSLGTWLRPLVTLIAVSVPPIAGAIVFWGLFVACLDRPIDPAAPQVRVVASWDPLGCARPHRVVLTLEDADGAVSQSAGPCALGGLVIDLPHQGRYRGGFAAEPAGGAAAREVAVDLVIDRDEVRWRLAPPP